MVVLGTNHCEIPAITLGDKTHKYFHLYIDNRLVWSVFSSFFFFRSFLPSCDA
jgi:hypothetical protein